jgi:hypothetical protein
MAQLLARKTASTEPAVTRTVITDKRRVRRRSPVSLPVITAKNKAARVKIRFAGSLPCFVLNNS